MGAWWESRFMNIHTAWLCSRFIGKIVSKNEGWSLDINHLKINCMLPAGVLLFDRSQGFWLSHSIPHFPSFPERGYVYPSSGKVNGQTALCVTHNYDQLLLVGEWPAVRQQALMCSTAPAIIRHLSASKTICRKRCYLVLCKAISVIGAQGQGTRIWTCSHCLLMFKGEVHSEFTV